MKRAVIVVLNWNGIGDTLECLESLQKQTYKNYSILVIDNGSTDSSKNELEKYKSKHKNTNVIFNKTNAGFAGGVNIGIEWALDHKYGYIALFNNDATAQTNWLEKLIDEFDKEKVGISVGLLLRADGKTIDSAGDYYSIWGLPFPRDRDKPTNDASAEGLIFGATGGACVIKSELIKDIGLFDKDFFAYYEDTDFSFRAQLAGWKIAYTPTATAYHKQGATANKLSGFATYQTFKNWILVFIRDVPSGLIFKIGTRLLLAYILMLFNSILKGRGISAIKGMFAGLALAVKKTPQRWGIQRNKRVSAKYIKEIILNDIPPDQTGLRKFRRYVSLGLFK